MKNIKSIMFCWWIEPFLFNIYWLSKIVFFFISYYFIFVCFISLCVIFHEWGLEGLNICLLYIFPLNLSFSLGCKYISSKQPKSKKKFLIFSESGNLCLLNWDLNPFVFIYNESIVFIIVQTSLFVLLLPSLCFLFILLFYFSLLIALFFIYQFLSFPHTPFF